MLLKESFVLIVNDKPDNLQSISNILQQRNLHTLFAPNGMKALESLALFVPDLILLDTQTPNLNSAELCHHIKNNPATADIPIIVINQKDTGNIGQIFAIGASDYLSRPFAVVELLARVRNHLELRHTRKALWEKEQQLAKFDTEKYDFLGVVAHDLRNPLAMILASVQTALEQLPTDNLPYVRRNLEHVELAVGKMNKLIKNLLYIHTIESGKLELELQRLNLTQIVQNIVSRCRKNKCENIHFQIEAMPTVELVSDEKSLRQIIETMINDTIQHSRAGKDLWIRIVDLANYVRLEMQGEGEAGFLDVSNQQTVQFREFIVHSKSNPNTLELVIVKKLVTVLKGRIGYESTGESTNVLVVELSKSFSCD